MKSSGNLSTRAYALNLFLFCYRAAGDVIRRHDEILKQKKAFRDVFLPEAIAYRNKYVCTIYLLSRYLHFVIAVNFQKS